MSRVNYEDRLRSLPDGSRWTPLSYTPHKTDKGWKVPCRCTCGTVKDVAVHNLTAGISKSCGCLKSESTVQRCRTHGLSDTGTHKSWLAMRRRCYDINYVSYPNYGGRGIKVCDRWKDDFEAFYTDMGDRPDGCSLDRIDVNGNYTPENCKWSTRSEQQTNKQETLHIEWRGQKRSAMEWSKLLGIHVDTLRRRVRRGWDVERAMTAPIQTGANRGKKLCRYRSR